MTYFPDGSPYSYMETKEDPSVLNIGWLDGGHPYTTGTIPRELRDKLARLCRQGIRRTRGFHRCDLCPQADPSQPPQPTVVRDEAGEFLVGSAEIRIGSSSRITFASPDMVIHYVEEHAYKPPDAFLDALRTLP